MSPLKIIKNKDKKKKWVLCWITSIFLDGDARLGAACTVNNYNNNDNYNNNNDNYNNNNDDDDNWAMEKHSSTNYE